MDLNSFKDWALGQGSVAKYDDGKFKGQCVSLINQYCYRVLGVPAGAWGNAKDWATSPNVAQYFDHASDIQSGDIIVYPGSFGGGDGHIAISLGNGQMLDQNSDNTGTIKVHSVWNGYSAVLRSKNQGGEMFNQGDAVNLSDRLFNTHNPPDGIKNQVGKPWKEAMYGMLDSGVINQTIRTNTGDNANIKNRLGDLTAGRNFDNVAWKDIWYNVGDPAIAKLSQGPDKYTQIGAINNEPVYKKG